MVGYEEQLLGGGGEDLSLSQPDPLVLELNRLQNTLKDKERELGAALAEIKALRTTEASKDKAIEELENEVSKFDKKLTVTENLLEHKNLEIKKLANEKKDALVAQYAAESTLRRVYANQKDDCSLPIESFIAPLEAEIKMYKNEIAALQEDKKAMERLTKSKESALLEAERILQSALERALIVEEVQNQNYELKRQIEICLEENKLLEKTNRQKVLEVEKLSHTIQELEEAILAGGAAANTIRDYRRQISELKEEKRFLERELAKAKVSANRVATVIANEWKDENDKVMPIKKWLEERRLLQAEMQRLRDKLAVSERTAKAEAQLKEKFKLRLNTLEEGIKHVSSLSLNPGASGVSPKPAKTSNILGFLTNNGGLRKRSSSQPRASTVSRSTPLQQPNADNEKPDVAVAFKRADSFKKKYGSGDNKLRNSLWVSRSKIIDSTGKENTDLKVNTDANTEKHKFQDSAISAEMKNKDSGNDNLHINTEGEDVVSGFLYDRLQKEVLHLRKYCEAKDSNLDAKDQEIQMLIKKVNTLAKAVEVESKKVKREMVAREKEATVSTKPDSNKTFGSMNSSKR
ncbi:microtubule-associated protein 70-5 [Euphorbia lathyris]|uniref:microtubule-associated protein 70-5 n=1 Tax=Euphorbia lathyris TaxID=212925 RepID=UPI003313F598